jgi:hypothetical protein
MHLAANGYVGLARVEEDRINVCGLFRLDPKLSGKGPQTLERYMRAGSLARLAERVFAARLDEESFLGVAGFRLGRQTRPEALALLGDAWGMIPPFTGNGMSMAFESAAIAVEPLHSWRVGRATWEKPSPKFSNSLPALHEAHVLGTGHASIPNHERRTGLIRGAVALGFLPFKSAFGRCDRSDITCGLCQRLSDACYTQREC